MNSRTKYGDEIPYGQSHQQLLTSYDHILRKNQIDPSSDSLYYKLLMKIDLKKERGRTTVFEVLQREMEKITRKKQANDHRCHTILARAYYALVQNMVEQIMVPSKNHDPDRPDNQRPKLISGGATLMEPIQKAHHKTKKNVVVGGRTGSHENWQNNGKENLKTCVEGQPVRRPKSKSKILKENQMNHVLSEQPVKSSGKVNTQGPETGSINTHYTSESQAHWNHNSIMRTASTLSLQNKNKTCYSSIVTLKRGSIPDLQAPQFLQNSDRGGRDTTALSAHLSEFKILLKCLRKWRQYISTQKQRMLKENVNLLENLAISIHYHEQTLLTKAYIGFKANLNKMRTLNLNAKITHRRHGNRVKMACIKQWFGSSLSRLTRKNLVFTAMDSWSQTVTRRLFESWRDIYFQKRHQKQKMLSRMVAVPSSIKVILAMASGKQGKQHSENLQVINRALRLHLQKKVFLSLKQTIYRDGVQIKKLHLRHILRMMKQTLQKRFKLRFRESHVSNQIRMKSLKQSFNIWGHNFIIRQNQQYQKEQASLHNQGILKCKVLRAFLLNLQAQQTSDNNLKVSINTSLTRLLLNTLQGWRFVTSLNRKQRQLSLSLRYQSQQRSKGKFFYLWIQTAYHNRKADTICHMTLMRKVYNVLLDRMAQRELIAERKDSIREFSRLQLLKVVCRKWRQVSLEAEKQRHLRLTVLNFASLSLQRKIVAAWIYIKNQNLEGNQKVRLNKHNKDATQLKSVFDELRQHSLRKLRLKMTQALVEASAKIRIESAVLFIWSSLFQKRFVCRKKQIHLDSRHQKKMKLHYLSSWFSRVGFVKQRKFEFYSMRARNMMRTAFSSINAFRSEKSHFRSRLHRFLRMRARSLLQIAFNGLTTFTHKRILSIKLKKVAKYVFLRRLLLCSFAHLKREWSCTKAERLVSARTRRSLFSSCLRRWKLEYLRVDINKRLADRRTKSKLMRCWHRLQIKAAQLKTNRVITSKITEKHQHRLQVKAIKGLNQYRVKRQGRELQRVYSQVKDEQRLMRKAIKAMEIYASVKTEMREQTRLLAIKRERFLAYSFMAVLKGRIYNKKTQQMVIKPVAKKAQLAVMRVAIHALYSYAYNKYLAKDRKHRHQKKWTKINKRHAFYTLANYASNRFALKQMKQQACRFDQLRLSRTCFFQLLKNKLISCYSREVISTSHLQIMHKFLIRWYDLYTDYSSQRPLIELADRHFLQTQFFKFIRAFRIFKTVNNAVRIRYDIATTYHARNFKMSVLKAMQSHTVSRRQSKIRSQLSRNILQGKAFQGWLGILESLKESQRLRLINKRFRRFTLICKVFQHLAMTTKYLINQKLQVECITKSKHNVVKQKCLKSLISNVLVESSRRHVLRQKIPLFICVKMRDPFCKWRNQVLKQRLLEAAEWFNRQICQMHVLKHCLSKLRFNNVAMRQDRNRSRLINIKSDLHIKQKWFSQMIRCVMDTNRLNDKAERYLTVKTQQMLKTYILAFQKQALVIKGRQNQRDQADLIRQGNLARKSFIALQKNQCTQQIGLYIQQKRKTTIQTSTFNHWSKSCKRLQQLRNVLASLKMRVELNSKREAFGALAKLSYLEQCCEALMVRRVQRRALMFFDLLRRKMIYSKIIDSYAHSRRVTYMRKVFESLIENQEQRNQHYSMVALQVSSLHDQSNFEILACAFTSIRLNAKVNKMKRVAVARYIQTLLKKGLLSLAIGTQKSLICEYAQLELKIKSKAKFFELWFEAIEFRRTAAAASHVIAENKLRRIIVNWRYQTEKKVIATIYSSNYIRRRLLPLTFQALLLNSHQARYTKHCAIEISQNSAFNLQKQVLLKWMEYHNLKKISVNMQRFYCFKLMKNVVDSWKGIIYANNKMRRSHIDIRRTLRQRPELAQPLFVIRNILLYKSFQMFKMGVKSSIRQVKVQTQASFAIYLSLLRKGFESLSVNVVSRQQRKRIAMIRNYFMLKRWFANLKNGTQKVRRRRSVRTESAIFNFLNTERKGFNMLLWNANERRQLRMKLVLANEIYMKGLVIKSITALRRHGIDQGQRNMKFNKTGNNDFSYMIHCDISQFDNLCPMSASSKLGGTTSAPGYNAHQHTAISTILQPSIKMQSTTEDVQQNFDVRGLLSATDEAPQIEDEYIDRKKLVGELYEKRLMFKCFYRWVGSIQHS